MAGLLDILTGGGRDPAVAAFLSADRGLLNRLGAYAQAKQAAPILEQRRQILQDAYTPAQAEQAQINVDPGQDPVARALGLASTQRQATLPTAGAPTIPRQADASPLVLASAQNAPGTSVDALLPQVSRKVTQEARPASYDVDTAISRLRSIGDLDTASALIDSEYKRTIAGGRAGGKGEKWYANRQMVKGSDGKMYNQILSDAGNSKLVPIDGDLTGELKQMDVGGQRMWVNSYTGEPVRSFSVTPTAYQSWQMDDDAQARQSSAVEQAKGGARAVVDRATDRAEKVEKASEALAELDSLTNALGRLEAPIYTKYQNVAGFFGGGDPDYQEALGEVDRASGRMLEYVNRLPGAATDADRDIFMASAGVVRDANLPLARRIAAAESAKASFRRLVEKYGNGAAPIQPPTPAPRPAAQSSPAATGPVTVRTPDGKVFTFPDQKAANNFKLKAGIR